MQCFKLLGQLHPTKSKTNFEEKRTKDFNPIGQLDMLCLLAQVKGRVK